VSLEGVEGMCPRRLAGRVGAVCREDTSVAFGTPLVFNRSR
jgi:hypothetical protein